MDAACVVSDSRSLHTGKFPPMRTLRSCVALLTIVLFAQATSAQLSSRSVDINGVAREYLRCGILAHGFARAYCSAWGHDFLIAFSCKGRDICPSCATRRMAETAAHLTDQVLPPRAVPPVGAVGAQAGPLASAREARGDRRALAGLPAGGGDDDAPGWPTAGLALVQLSRQRDGWAGLCVSSLRCAQGPPPETRRVGP
ncbi:MAG: hypothetical protein CL908_06865 [Deltaproteobacteria bacterium]|jgi:hypothetical protein|nr:hypothetical protein [Deltaproteobacteria bacterium]